MEERYRKAHEKKLNEAAGSVSSTGIGKYLNLGAVGGVSQDEDPSKKRELGTLEAMEMTHQQEVKRSKNNSKKNVSSGFGNFDTW